MSEAPTTLESLLRGGLVVSPLGRRLLANTALADRRKLHEILLVFEAAQPTDQALARLKSLRVEPTVLNELVRRGFLMKREPNTAAAAPQSAPAPLPPVGRRASGPGAATLHGQNRGDLAGSGGITFEPVPIDKLLQAEKLKAIEAELQRTAHTTHTFSRRALVDNLQKLSPAATQLLAVLPASLTVQNLVERYPRILNQLADDWKDPQRFRATMDSYFIDTRGGRQGFPLPVVQELMALRDFYNTEVHPDRAAGFAAAPDIYRR
jgi:hypothetical protein